jgi:DNA-binding LacI/PurR family transcriptional regulator
MVMAERSFSVTIRDVAREAGVSVATVSRYINQSAPVSEELALRIQQIMDQLDYVPQAAARNLAIKKKNTIGLLLTNMDNAFFVPLLAGIEEVVREHGFNLLIASWTSNPQSRYPYPLGVHNTDGLLVFADSLTDEQIAKFHSRDLPLVLIHRTPKEGLDIPFVTVENKAATRKLITHLISEHGCQRILFMRGPEQQEDSYWREFGYRTALADFGIEHDERLILCGHFERGPAYNTLKLFLADPDHPPFDAVFAGDDEAALGVYDALKEAGLRIPQDIKVVGFDDSDVAPLFTPPLTTVRAPTREVGRMAARQLFCLLEDKEPLQATLLPTEIIIRQSCGCHEYPEQ